MFGFEQLEVWQKAIEFANKVYRVTRNFPGGERFGLTSQIRRSSVSVAANIAEGSGRNSKKEFVRFIEIAFGSLMETISHTVIARDQSLLNDDDYQDLYDRAQQLSKMLSGLRRSLQSQSENNRK